MKTRLLQWLAQALYRRMKTRMATSPDFIIGGASNPYLARWWVIPRNRFFNIYLHAFFRSDDDRALHDHPWTNASFLLCGQYTEHTIAAGGIHHKTIRRAGDLAIRPSGKHAHRIELHAGAVMTLFFTGPVYRKWGFHCPERGWVYYRDFVDDRDHGAIGKGCEP
jgi:hypothetical protein